MAKPVVLGLASNHANETQMQSPGDTADLFSGLAPGRRGWSLNGLSQCCGEPGRVPFPEDPFAPAGHRHQFDTFAGELSPEACWLRARVVLALEVRDATSESAQLPGQASAVVDPLDSLPQQYLRQGTPAS